MRALRSNGMTNVSLAEVVTIYATNCRDIPEMLRGAADNIELEQADGIITETMLGIQLTESGSLAIYGWGEADNLRAIAMLQLAITRLSNDTLGWD